VVKALADPEMRRRFAEVGLRPDGGSPQAMSNIVRDQLARYGKAIKDNGIKGD
jgi:tripartite-type tricarboxylate transporter receptor subunit TctC